jgi:hypothetical protein
MHIYSLLLHLRGKWGLGELDGVTNYHPLVAGVWIPSPYISLSNLTKLVTDPRNPLLVVTSLTSSSHSCKTTRGTQSPYLGNITSDKAISKWTKPIDASPPLKDALRIIQIAKLASEPGSDFRIFLEEIAMTRTSLPVSILYEMSKEQIGGTTGHRLNISAALQGSRIASLPNWSTHFTVSSNLSREMGANDYPISFHEYYLTMLCMSRVFFGCDLQKPPFGLVHLIDLSVLRPMQDSFITIQPYVPVVYPLVPKGSYYLYATSVTLSARSHVGMSMPFEMVPERQATLIEAVSAILISSMTGNLKLVRKPGYLRSTESHRLLLDLPEVSLITLDEYITAGAISVVCHASRRVVSMLNKSEATGLTVLRACMESSFVLAPLMLATISMAVHNHDNLLRGSAGSHTSERGIVHLSCVLARRAALILETGEFMVPPMFEHTKGLMSSAIATRIYVVVLRMALTDPRSVPSCKFLCRLVGKLLDKPTEETRVATLLDLLTIVKLGSFLSRDPRAAESVVREARLRISVVSLDPPLTPTLLPPMPPRSSISTDAPLDLSVFSSTSSPEVLVHSWSLRPYPGKSDSWLKWNPLLARIKPGSVVYIIGIGAGGLLQCIPHTCKVFGVDLPSAVQSLGQSFVDYTGSFPHPGYSTRPLTWLYDLSSLDRDSTRNLLEDISLSKAEVVVIDVDRVPPEGRLRLRLAIAEQGTECWVRVHATKEGIRQIILSCDAVRENSDEWWEPSVSCGEELILGRSRRPLGLLQAHSPHVPSRVLLFVKPMPRWDEVFEFVLRFGGSLRDMDDLQGFVLTRGRSRASEGSGTPLKIYTDLQSEPAGALKFYGRFLCRICVCVVPWFL